VEDIYGKAIAEIIRHKNQLSQRERDFIFGAPGETRPPVKDRYTLSMRQKAWLRKIYKKAVPNGRLKLDELEQQKGPVKLEATDSGTSVTVNGMKVGENVAKREADVIGTWLCTALNDIEKALKKKRSKGEDPPF